MRRSSVPSAWTIEFSEEALKELAALDRDIARRIRGFLRDRIANLPDPSDGRRGLEGAKIRWFLEIPRRRLARDRVDRRRKGHCSGSSRRAPKGCLSVTTGLSPGGDAPNDVPPARPPMIKPSSPITYIEGNGVDVWPSFRRRDRAVTRVLGEESVHVREWQGDDKVLVRVGGKERVLTRAEWSKLPADVRPSFS